MDKKQKARELRAATLTSIYGAQSGHPGGSLSVVEILQALYYDVANIKPEDPQWEDRDRIVLSKGHACPALYAVLADKGYYPSCDLDKLRQADCHLQGHPDACKTPGIDVNTGSLGQGVAIAGGLAMAAKHNGRSYQVFAIVGDGELQEGICWEAAMSAAHYKLDNLVVLLDYNGLQIDGRNDEVMSLGDIMKKYEAFGFDCQAVDGHDADAIAAAIRKPVSGKPRFICCKTVKGKGVSFMEDQAGWHGKAPSKDEYEQAMKELGVEING